MLPSWSTIKSKPRPNEHNHQAFYSVGWVNQKIPQTPPGQLYLDSSSKDPAWNPMRTMQADPLHQVQGSCCKTQANTETWSPGRRPLSSHPFPALETGRLESRYQCYHVLVWPQTGYLPSWDRVQWGQYLPCRIEVGLNEHLYIKPSTTAAHGGC